MEYLQKVLGLKLTYINDDIKHIPNFIGTRYVLRNVLLDRQKAVFIYPKTELEQIETLKKHISKIKSIVNLPVVMILDEITYRQKEYLLREKIPFVVNNKQNICLLWRYIYRIVAMQKHFLMRKYFLQLRFCCCTLYIMGLLK